MSKEAIGPISIPLAKPSSLPLQLPPPNTSRPTGKSRKSRSLRAVALGLTVCGLVGIGFVAGWEANIRFGPQAERTEPQIVEVPALQEQADLLMPDVRGLSLAEAKQVMADLQLDPAGIKLTEQEWAGEPGVVIAQDPVVGEKSKPVVHLTVARSAVVGNYVGLPQEEVVEALHALGSDAVIKFAFDLTQRSGTVLAVEPAPGEPLPPLVEVTVAQAGSSAALHTLQTAEVTGSRSDCRKSEVTIEGRGYPDALRCSTAREGEPTSTVWLVGKHGSVLSAGVGLADTGKADSTARVQVLADGKEVAALDVSYGKLAPVSVDISGVLRLEIVTSSATGADVYLTDAIVKGTDSDIDQLVTEK